MKRTVILLGDGGVGKTSLVIRYIADRFEEEYDPTVEESYYKTIQNNGEEFKLEILDTAGQDDFEAIRQEYYRKAECVIGVFSVKEKELNSFFKLKEYWGQVVEERHYDQRPVPPLIVVGNKIDINHDFNNAEVNDWITSNNFDIIYTSSKTNQNIDTVFNKVIDILINMNPESKPIVKDKKPKKDKTSKCIIS